MLEGVTVEIVRAVGKTQPPSTQVEYEVRNHTRAPIWLVNDKWLIWSRAGKTLELSFKRGKMRKGSQVFGYFPPAVVRVDPGGSVRTAVNLAWPQQLDPLWNFEQSAAPPPGEYRLSVRVGFGTSPEPGRPLPGESVEDPVFRWQKEAVSPAVLVTIPSY